jgi:polyphosphate kinase
VRGICCLRPGRPGLSENIEVRSIVGEYLEHARLFYFHHNGEARLYAGSADAMVRSFDRRIEAIFLIQNPQLRREAIHILQLNLLDTQNSYVMREDGAYIRQQPAPGEPAVNIHRDFYRRPDEAQLANATPEGLLALLHEQAAQRQRLAAAEVAAAATVIAPALVEDGADSFGQGDVIMEEEVEHENDIAATVVDETA